MRRLTLHSPIPIMADEALKGPRDALEFAKDRSADVFSIKPPQAGGLFAAGRVAAIAEAANIGIYGGTMLEGSVGTIAAAQLYSTFAKLDWGTELFGPLLQTEEILVEPLQYENFGLKLPKGPGTGVTLDMDKLQHFRRDGAPRTSVMPQMESTI